MFKTLNPFVQSIVGWITLAGFILSGFYAFLAFANPVLQGRHWTEIVLLAILMSLATLLAIAVIAAIAVRAYRWARPIPASKIAGELERTKERLKRAEERLDGARVVPAVGNFGASEKPSAQVLEPPLLDNTASAKRRLTDAERDRAAQMLREIFDFVAADLKPFYHTLSASSSGGPKLVIHAVEKLEEERGKLANRVADLWHKNSYFLELLELDILTILQTLEALKNPMSDAKEAKDWPEKAQLDRMKPIAQLMSDLGGKIGNICTDIAAKRKEYIDG